ncbi:MAG: hypothetical protein A3H35_12770 [Betaproteobacteria bacterium RIFCSPLOWO2_02_FULL_62_17]|nr:MAG: hypothetical protein A3H35_12770 [Betaproteobacteria bacterium RIFCSPLOWO2_02_FULL_62_17]
MAPFEGLFSWQITERTNVPGCGKGLTRKAGWFGLERRRWRRLFKLLDQDLKFFRMLYRIDRELARKRALADVFP